MSDNVIDSLVIKLGLDVEELKRGINEAKTQLAAVDQQISQTQAKTSEATSDSLKGVSDTAKNAKKGTDEATKGLGQLLSGADKLNSALTRLDTSVVSKMKAFAQTVVAPVAGVLAIGGAIQNYIGGVAEVARLTGQYSQKLEEWRYKQQLLSRVTKEEIELYIKGQRALKAFRLTMYDLVSYGMRAAVPYIEKISSLFEKSVNYIKENGPDLSRFFKVLAGVITVALIPAFIKLAAAIWANPLTWLIATLIAAALVLDDFIVYLHGGKTAFGDLWAKLGDGPTLLKQINDFFKDAKDKLEELGPTILRVGIAFGLFKIATTVVNGLALAIKALRLALLSNPVTAIFVGIAAAIMWLYDAWQRAGGDWGKVVDIIIDDFWNLVDTGKKILGSLVDAFTGTIKSVLSSLDDDFKRFIEDLARKIPLFGDEIADWLHGVWSDEEDQPKVDPGNINPATDAPLIGENSDKTVLPTASAGKAVMPWKKGEFYTVSSQFNPRRKHPVTGKIREHKGTDFAMPTGTNVLSTARGKVIAVANQKNGAGLYVKIRHGEGFETLYMHLSKILVKAGDTVNRGQVIALSGDTGKSTGAHLHYEVRKNGKAVNPYSVVVPDLESENNSSGSSSPPDSASSYNNAVSEAQEQISTPSATTSNAQKELEEKKAAAAQFAPDSFKGLSYQDYVNRLSNGVIDTVNYMQSTSGSGISSYPISVNRQAISNIQNSNRGGNTINRNGDINVTVNTNSSRPGDIANQTANRVSQADANALVHAVDSGQRT